MKGRQLGHPVEAVQTGGAGGSHAVPLIDHYEFGRSADAPAVLDGHPQLRQGHAEESLVELACTNLAPHKSDSSASAAE